ncbi:MAG: helix-turn-helix domain-containing protein [Anaerolineae bacterium]|nr:helix-turn-helix domain-containing protein [Anaerolineae bacterium]
MVLTAKPEIDFDVDPRLQNGDISLPGEERYSDSPFVERVWHSRSDQGGLFTSTAESHWEIVVTKYQGSTTLTVRGPETQATAAYCPPDAEFTGIVFKIGTFMPLFPASMVMDRRDLNLPRARSNAFWLDSSVWEFPTFENADTFINRLVRKDLIVRDPVIDVALREQPSSMSRRTIQRRFLQATGLTYNNVFQIQRAHYATDLLKQGVSILDTVEQAGYTDQSHMTRALRHLMGPTPGQIVSGTTEKPMSFLFKTPPF